MSAIEIAPPQIIGKVQFAPCSLKPPCSPPRENGESGEHVYVPLGKYTGGGHWFVLAHETFVNREDAQRIIQHSAGLDSGFVAEIEVP